MQVDFMQYEQRTQDAMREVVRASLDMIARDGLIGDHHVYVVFDTRARGVELSRKLREQFPGEMSVILQHQFDHLAVDDRIAAEFRQGAEGTGHAQATRATSPRLRGEVDLRTERSEVG